jgi:hypothetical protein
MLARAMTRSGLVALLALGACERAPAVPTRPTPTAEHAAASATPAGSVATAAPSAAATADAAPTASAPPVASAAPPPPRTELEGVIDFVQSSLRDGVVGRQPEIYLRMYTDDARIEEGRREEPDEFDAVSNVAGARALAVAQARGTRTTEFTYDFEDVTSKATISEVSLRWTIVSAITGPYGNAEDRVKEVHRLRRTPEGWRVFYARSWRVSETFDGRTLRFDAKYWAKRETELAAARKKGDAEKLLGALAEAHHLREAYELAKRLTVSTPTNAYVWHQRAALATQLGFIDDAVAAYRKRADLDPTARSPGWAQAHPAW